jgi:hypothetical protein
MAIVYLKREGQKLVPTDQDSLDKVMKFKEDDVMKTDMKKPRNYEFHKKAFALLNLLWENSPLNLTFDKFRGYCMLNIGRADVYDTPYGKTAIPESISFDNMEQIEFEKVYSDILQFGIEHIGADKEMIEEQLVGFL